jgi:YfiH family protein
VHGVEHVRLDGTEAPREVLSTRADVILSTAPGVACGVRSADCVPVLVAERASGAVVAVHSGWRGTVQDVVAAALAALRDAVGTQGELVAAIGPHIETCCFEIGDDVAADLAAASSLGERAIRRGEARPHADLRAIVRAQLEAAGVRGEAIDDVRGCTVCDAERFHSYRRDGARGGRLLSAIVSRGPAAPASPG